MKGRRPLWLALQLCATGSICLIAISLFTAVVARPAGSKAQRSMPNEQKAVQHVFWQESDAPDILWAMRFQAMHFTADKERQQLRRAWVEYAPTGAVLPSLRWLPDSAHHVAVDPKGPMFYALLRHTLVTWDWQTGKTSPVALDPKHQSIGWPSGLAFDSKRRRLVVASSAGVGYLHAWHPDNKKWSIINDLKGIDLVSLTYATEKDCFYGLQLTPRERKPIICRFDANGVLKQRIELDTEIAINRIGYPPAVQIVAVGRLIALLTPPPLNAPRRDDPIDSVCFLIDPQSAKITWHGELRPHDGNRKIVVRALPALWQSLKNDDYLKADATMWCMVVGGEQTVKFIQSKLKPVPVLGHNEVQALIKDLDANQFRKRELAFVKLQRLGEHVENDLRQSLDANPTLEVSLRLRRLLAQMINVEQNSPLMRREARAVDVLGRIGSPAAVRYLRQLATGSAGSLCTRRAKDALLWLGQS